MDKRLSTLLALLMLASLILSACGGAEPAATESATTVEEPAVEEPAAEEPAAEEPAAEEPAAEEPAAEEPAEWAEADATKSFTFHMAEKNPVLDKWTSRTNNAIKVISYLIFDPLIIMDEDGSYQPWLAKAWEFSDDFSSVTFELRDDVYFTNGAQMTADDVMFTFELLRDDAEHKPDNMAKNWRLFIGELEKVDDFSFTLHFTQPMPEFYYQVTDPSTQIICKSAYEEMGYEAFWEHPIGTGPYVVESWDQPNSILKVTLRTDEHGYWGYDYTGLHTNVKDITIANSPEGQTRLASLRAGEVQMINIVPTDEKANLDSEGFTTMVLVPMNAVWLQVNSAPGDILEDQRLREALSLSIDRDLIVETLLSGFATPAHWPSRPGDLGYVDKDGYVYDPEKAKQLVQESGYNGEEIELVYTTSTVNIGNELGQAIQSMAAEVGLNLKITPLESAVYNEARTNHDLDLALAGIGVSGNFWYKPVHDVTGTDRFNTGHQNQELKDLALSLESIIDPVAADAVYRQVYEIQTTTFEAVIYLYFPTYIGAWDSKVTGVMWHQNQFPDLKFLVIED